MSPRFIRAYAFFDRCLFHFIRLWSLVRDEILWAWTVPEQREQITFQSYEVHSTFLSGGETFEGGLFPWERLAITSPPFPQKGHILVGGCGGGREVAELRKLGYEVTAFEPSPSFAEGSRRLAASLSRVRFAQASYRDLLAAFSGAENLLTPLIRNATFDGMILGWGSFSHVTDITQRRNLLCALRKLYPTAPLLVGFTSIPDIPAGFIDRMRPPMRRILTTFGAPSRAADGDVFTHGSGFTHCFTPKEFRQLASDAGYQIAHANLFPSNQAYALLTQIL
ncbi:MAG TPA: class I SAM-dependent methyltransferase [Bdellovibrionota bacterium]|nr:class I SAM-dependent methyltransferase [Bdellovibrionota bacterium]